MSEPTRWRDLSGSEIVARLVNRGVPPDHARAYVRQRDTSDGQDVIDDLLTDRAGPLIPRPDPRLVSDSNW